VEIVVREVVDGLMYILSTGCQWRAIPKDLPPRSTLYDYFDLWSVMFLLRSSASAIVLKCPRRLTGSPRCEQRANQPTERARLVSSAT
jgi:transposase